MLQETLEGKLPLRGVLTQDKRDANHCTCQSLTKTIMGTIVGRIMAPRDFHGLISGTCEYVTSMAKGTLPM